MAGRNVIQAQRITRHASIQKEVEDLRWRLPANEYLMVLHRMATEGIQHTFDARGKVNGTRQVTSKEQADIAKYLLDKVMPNQAPAKIETPEELTAESTAENLATLNTDELRRLVAHKQPATTAIPFPVPAHDE